MSRRPGPRSPDGCDPDGPLGDLFAMQEAGIQIVANLAPVAPEVVLAKLELELDGGLPERS